MADSSNSRITTTSNVELERGGGENHHSGNIVHPIIRELSPVFESRSELINAKEEKHAATVVKDEPGVEVPNNTQQQTSLGNSGTTGTQVTDSESEGPIRQTPKYIGRLVSNNNVLHFSEHTVDIGRNSSTSRVNFNVNNIFVSRKHLQILYNPPNGDFYMVCLSKNGVFLDGVFTRKSVEPVKLPNV